MKIERKKKEKRVLLTPTSPWRMTRLSVQSPCAMGLQFARRLTARVVGGGD